MNNLKRCVDALLSVATTHPWELIIVDNGSNDGTSEYLASLKASQLERPQIVTAFEIKRGLAAARNRGWPLASASIVAFTDDDCYVAKDYVDSILQVFEENTEIGFLGGRILLYDSSDLKITIEESTDRRYFRPRAFVAAGNVHGANMAFRRTALERIGGFDDRLGPGTRFNCEDVDAIAAALWAGIPGAYDPRPVVYHHHGRKTEVEARELLRSYDAGRGAYFAKYIMKKASRWEYCRAWINSARGDEYMRAVRGGPFPKMERLFRELSSGVRYVVSDLLPGAIH